MKSIVYNVYPQPFTERVLDAICIRFDLERDYFFQIQWEIPEEKEDEDFRYYVGILCHALKVHGGLGDMTIAHFLPWLSVKDVYYYLDCFKLLIDYDSSARDELNQVLLIADQLDVKTISNQFLYVSLD